MDHAHGIEITPRGASIAAHARRAVPRIVLRLSAVLAIALLGAAAWADPPARVGRVSALDGSATLQQGDAPPVAAALNWPVTSGERLVVEPGSRLELRIGSTALQLDGDSTLDVDRLDDQRIDLQLQRGRVALRVRRDDAARAITMATPQGSIAPLGAGRWRIDTALAADTSRLATFDGAASFTGRDDARTRATVEPGRMLLVSGVDALSTQTTPIDESDFDRWVVARDSGDDINSSAAYVSGEMTGAEDLDRFGSWSVSTEYGPVWYPSAVALDWCPYRVGRWVWVAPWGWTWVDAAPWGFAPFHYGRWALIEGRWGWAPGRHVAAPVYAPALVGWIGRPGWSASVSVGASVGWFPLAPLEPYYPAYGASLGYVRNVNGASVRDVTRITTVIDVNSIHYANREVARAVTVVPAAAMASGRDVARAAVPIRDARALAELPPPAREPLLSPPAHAAAAARAPARASAPARLAESPAHAPAGILPAPSPAPRVGTEPMRPPHAEPPQHRDPERAPLASPPAFADAPRHEPAAAPPRPARADEARRDEPARERADRDAPRGENGRRDHEREQR